MLTQTSTEDRDSVRELMAIRCPVGDTSTWELELGMLPDPRPAMEVLPGKSPVTVSVLELMLLIIDNIISLLLDVFLAYQLETFW